MSLSRAHVIVRNHLRSICKRWNVTLQEEARWDTLRFDFLIQTTPPVNIEVQGVQHYLTKPDGFFFKDSDALLAYKNNDAKRRALHRGGRIHLIEFTTQEVENGISETKLQEMLLPFLEGGENLSERRRKEKAEEYKAKQKEAYKKRYEALKEFRNKRKEGI